MLSAEQIATSPPVILSEGPPVIASESDDVHEKREGVGECPY